jgi:chemotaxis protein MotB
MARKEKPPEIPKDTAAEDNFNMMFVSLNLILLSFFILLNTIAVRDAAKQRNAWGSLLGTFGILEGGASVKKDGANLAPTAPIFTDKLGQQAIERGVGRLLRGLGYKPGKPHVQMVRSADGIHLLFPNQLLFKGGGVQLNPEMFPLLDELSGMLSEKEQSVVVKGYADPARPAKYPSNIELSASRAVRVARYFIEGGGMPADAVRADGMGVRTGVKNARLVELIIPSKSLSRKMESPH